MNGRVEHLYLQPVRGQPGVALAPDAAMRCKAGLGIHGDVHAHRLSPRQVLVTLASELRDLRIAPGALLENIVISSDRPELFRPGSALLTASGVEIRLTMFCEPCKRIAPVAADFSRLVHRRGVLGVFATGGEIRIGDAVRLIGERYTPLPESAYQKFLAFVPTIPPGRVVRYVDVTVAIGVAGGFVRALPGYIRRSAGLGLPLHRIVNARGALLPFIPGQAGKLLAEGVIQRSDAATVDLAAFLWQGAA
ncbi:MGMT family protein [Duganella alba]|uniref:MGMT family protein n=1 Tax=Duganella alba TaxID=2666081 RepID=UPI00140CE5F3|nr:MGMT family protein [Duganella alba]